MASTLGGNKICSGRQAVRVGKQTQLMVNLAQM